MVQGAQGSGLRAGIPIASNEARTHSAKRCCEHVEWLHAFACVSYKVRSRLGCMWCWLVEPPCQSLTCCLAADLVVGCLGAISTPSFFVGLCRVVTSANAVVSFTPSWLAVVLIPPGQQHMTWVCSSNTTPCPLCRAVDCMTHGAQLACMLATPAMCIDERCCSHTNPAGWLHRVMCRKKAHHTHKGGVAPCGDASGW